MLHFYHTYSTRRFPNKQRKWQIQQINNVNVSSLANNMLFEALIKDINLITFPSAKQKIHPKNAFDGKL
jgi:hypothetical protein